MMWEFNNAQLIIMENFTSETSGFETIFYHPKANLCPYTVQTQKAIVHKMKKTCFVLLDCFAIFTSHILVVGIE